MINVQLSDSEAGVFKRLLKDLQDRYVCASCNDFTMEDTPENREVLEAAEHSWHVRAGTPQESRQVHLGLDHNQRIMTMDFVVLEHFLDKFGIAP